MPNCFSLTRKSSMDAGPVAPFEIDNEMREHFKEPPSGDLSNLYDC